MFSKGAQAALDQSLDKKSISPVSLSAFSFLFSEVVRQAQGRSSRLSHLEDRLAAMGYTLGARVLEATMLRERRAKREVSILGMLSFIHTSVWTSLFGRSADSLERGTSSQDEFMIVDKANLLNRFISVPRELSSLNCAAFVAGIVHGVLEAAAFPCDKVTAHRVVVDEATGESKTVILIKFNALKNAPRLADT